MITKAELQSLFDTQKIHQYKLAESTVSERIEKLRALKKAVKNTYRQAIREALKADFNKPVLETDLTEIYPIVSEIKFTIHHLKQWMKPKKVNTPLTLLGSSSQIIYEPKGVCLILSPWNFPINLTFGPLISAIAAGNTVFLKPSELAPYSADVMSKIISDCFLPNEVVLLNGDAELAKVLLKLPFNHIFFTGSPAVGKLVMQAASVNLSSVTLELGGKSPTVIDETANLKAAAKHVAWGKFLNSGQICIAPDYILVHETVKTEFIKALGEQIKVFYSEQVAKSKSYAHIINDTHYKRLNTFLNEAKNSNAVIEIGGEVDAETRFITPTVISNLADDSALLQEEIFGPILPIKTYKTLDEAIAYINAKEKPLALYMFSKNKQHINAVINYTRAGTTAINATILQYNNPNLPFGGSNNSGIGKSHGFFGFETFSNRRALLKQSTRSIIEFLFPPYTNLKEKLTELTIKWF